MSPKGSYTKTRGSGTEVALVYQDGYGNWGWWCPRCTPDTPYAEPVGQDGFKTRDGARRAAKDHEKGHAS